MVRQVWVQVRNAEAPLRVKVALALLVLYLLNPIDLIPDFIPVLGQLDDILISAAVLRWAAKYIELDIKKVVK
jgi:uncharacterized membrane protein YkvA (DUF1232 family)